MAALAALVGFRPVQSGVPPFTILDPQGLPVVGATVYVAPNGGSVQGVAGTTDVNGYWNPIGAPSGTNRLLVRGSQGIRTAVQISVGAPSQTVTLDPCNSITVTIEDDGVPVSDAICVLYDPQLERMVTASETTGTNGVASWSNLHEGPFMLKVAHALLGDHDVTYDVSGQTVRTFDIGG